MLKKKLLTANKRTKHITKDKHLRKDNIKKEQIRSYKKKPGTPTIKKKSRIKKNGVKTNETRRMSPTHPVSNVLSRTEEPEVARM